MHPTQSRKQSWLAPGASLAAVLVLIAFNGCGGPSDNAARKQASPSRGVIGTCPAIIDEPTQNQTVGSAINLRAHGDPACTHVMKAYIDDVECTPSPPFHCNVTASDFSPYPNWVGVTPGTHRLVVNSWDSVGNVSVTDATVFTYPGTTDSVLAGAGDIANLNAAQGATATLLSNINPNYVFTLGDNVYGSTTTDQGRIDHYSSYYDPTWGIPSLKAKTLPVPGNHDFDNTDTSTDGTTRVMSGYYTYFTGGLSTSPTKALTVGGTTWDTLHYGYDIPTSGAPWRYIAIDSGPCFNSGAYCALNGPEYSWLAGELAAHKKKSAGGTYAGIVAVTHFNRYTSAGCGSGSGNIDALYKLLYDNGVDLILDGHVHNYERFDRVGRAPASTTQGACGTVLGPVRDTTGPVVINVGTGGFGGTDGFAQAAYPATVTRLSQNGVIKITLKPTGFDFAFYSPSSYPTALDSGSFGLR